MIQAVLVFILKQSATLVVDQVFAIEVDDRSLKSWGKQFALGIFARQGGLIPDLPYERQVELRFEEVDRQIKRLDSDIKALRDQIKSLGASVQMKLDDAREEDLWQEIIKSENEADEFYSRFDQMTQAGTLEERQKRARTLGDDILASHVKQNVRNDSDRILGRDVGSAGEKVRGFLEIWLSQSLAEAEKGVVEKGLAQKGWQGNRLLDIYSILEAKFSSALTRQAKGARLVMEAMSGENSRGETDSFGYFSKVYYPMLLAQVEGFRQMAETLAVSILPISASGVNSLGVPDEIAGMLARLDYFTGLALGGKIGPQLSNAMPASSTAFNMVPTQNSCWGRVLVPASRWIGRKPGADGAPHREEASVAITDAKGSVTHVKGMLEVRSVAMASSTDRKPGYLLSVGGEPRKMDRFLVAHFTPREELPDDLQGPECGVILKDAKETPLASATAFVVRSATPSAKSTFASFTIAFTGGAEIRSLP